MTSDDSISLYDFLTNVPDYTTKKISSIDEYSGGTKRYSFDCRFHCDICDGYRSYFLVNDYYADKELINIVACCRDCRQSRKVFALYKQIVDGDITLMKFGESPQFGPPVPAKVSKLIGGERDLFFKGRRCEAQGLGIAAFSYYRRVIEAKKDRIFDEIIKIAKPIDSNAELIKQLTEAKEERQFTDGFNKIKDALPAILLIEGKNPLQLLYKALSESIHNLSDTECLEYATAVRAVLFEFADRLDMALSEERTLKDAVTLLSNMKAKQ